MKRVVVIGYGMAGARLAGELLARDRGLDLTVLGEEQHSAYNRILMSNLLAGKVVEADTMLPTPRGDRLHLRLGSSAAGIDPDAGKVSTVDGEVYPYDALVLATGSTAIVPPIEGLRDPLVFRTLDDCRRILDQAGDARTALVLGGGLLGLEAARGLALRGLTVTVVHARATLMDRQLDPGASAVLERTLRDLGITIVLDAAAVAALPHAGGLRLADGREFPADLTVVACGVRAETGLAEAAGLTVGRGVVVDDRLRTSDPAIYAIGDCAEYPGSVSGLVAPAWAQAKVVADLVTGADPDARYHPVPPVTRLKAAGIDLAAMGESIDHDDESAVTYADPGRRQYAKLVIRGGRLAGAIMLGDHPAIGAVIQYFDRQCPLPADPRPLLFARPGGGYEGGRGSNAVEAPAEKPALIPDAAVVCRCNTVTKGALTRAWVDGARDLSAATRAGTGCGGCRDVIAGITDWLSTVDSPGAGTVARNDTEVVAQNVVAQSAEVVAR
jgi:assimilatory nitrate reductase electron transfer subunit